MEKFFITIEVLAALFSIMFIMFQPSKSSDATATFSGSASQMVFGSKGSSGFLFRATIFAITIFFLSNLCILHIEHSKSVAKPVDTILTKASASPISDSGLGKNTKLPKW